MGNGKAQMTALGISARLGGRPMGYRLRLSAKLHGSLPNRAQALSCRQPPISALISPCSQVPSPMRMGVGGGGGVERLRVLLGVLIAEAWRPFDTCFRPAPICAPVVDAYFAVRLSSAWGQASVTNRPRGAFCIVSATCMVRRAQLNESFPIAGAIWLLHLGPPLVVRFSASL